MGGDHAVEAPRLEAIVAGDRFRPDALGTLGMTLTTEPPGDDRREVGVDELLAGALGDHLEAYAAAVGDAEEVVLAASFSKAVSTVIAPGLLAAWTLADVGLEATPANLALHFEDAQPRRCRIRDPSLVAVGRPERDRTLASLFAETIEPLFAAIEDASGAPARIQWSNVGNLTAFLYDELAAHGIGEDLGPDRRRLLASETSAWRSGPNPIEDPVTYEAFADPELPDRYQVRRVCCLKREIASKRPCASCPEIDTERRARRLAERGTHG